MLTWSAGLSWIGAAAIAVVRVVSASPTQSRLEVVVSSVALAAVLALPGAVALLGRWSGTPSLTIAGGVALAPMCLISIATLQLLPVAAVFVVAGVRAPGGVRWLDGLLATLTVVTTLTALVVLLLVHQESRTVGTASMAAGTSTVTSGASDVVSLVESFISVAFVGATLGIAWLATLNRPGRAARTSR